MNDKKISIILADDHRLVRKGLKAFLEDHLKLRIIAEAGNGKELLELLEHQRPDIVLLDMEMPVMNGSEALGLISRRFPGTKVILMSLYNEISYMSEFSAMGARAYVPKGSHEDVLIRAILNVYRDGYYFDPASSLKVLKGLRAERSLHPLQGGLALSKRETEILKELCSGKTNREIADICNIAFTTVSFHRSNIYKKTRSHNISDLIRYSIQNGIVDLNSKLTG